MSNTSFDDDQLFRIIRQKNGKPKYVPVYGVNWTDMARPGLWLVQTNEGSVSRKNLNHYLGELPELYPFANMVVAVDELATFIHDESQKPHSYADLANNILKWLAKKDLENRKIKEEKAKQDNKNTNSEDLKDWNSNY